MPNEIAPTTPQPVRASLRPKRTGEAPQPVFLMARTGGRCPIRVREADKALPGVFGVYRHNILDAEGKRLIDGAILNALPWAGKGPDPLGTTAEPITARMPTGAPMPFDDGVAR